MEKGIAKIFDSIFLEARPCETTTPMIFSTDYIIHIYRFEHGEPHSLVGTVEEVGIKGKRAFMTYDELWKILNSTEENLSSNRSPLTSREITDNQKV